MILLTYRGDVLKEITEKDKLDISKMKKKHKNIPDATFSFDNQILTLKDMEIVETKSLKEWWTRCQR